MILSKRRRRRRGALRAPNKILFRTHSKVFYINKLQTYIYSLFMLQNKIYKICFVSPENTISKILVFGSHTIATATAAAADAAEFSIPIKNPNIPINYISQNIHPDDTISLLKNKIIRGATAAAEEDEQGASSSPPILYEEMYLFFDKVVTRSEGSGWEDLYMELAEKNRGEIPSPEMLENLKKNMPSLREMDPRIATYNDFLNLPNKQVLRFPLGIRFEGTTNMDMWNPLFPINPAASGGAIAPPKMTLFENELIMDYICGDCGMNTDTQIIYVCLARDFVRAASGGAVYFPLLEKRGISPEDILSRAKETGPLVEIKDTIDVYYNIHSSTSSSVATPSASAIVSPLMEGLPPIISGIRSIYIKLHPQKNFVLPLESVFKILKTSPKIPFIKYNPGKNRENLYRLYTEKIAKNGRKIPILPINEINNISRKIGKPRQIAIYIRSICDLYCIFDTNGDMSIQVEKTDQIFSVEKIDEIIKQNIQPIIDTIHEHLGSSGYKLPTFQSIRIGVGEGSSGGKIEVITIDYVWYISYNKSEGAADINKQIIRFKPFFFSLFERIEKIENIKSGIKIKYKRVGNYQPMEAEKSLITDLFKKYGDVIQVLNEMISIYGYSIADARIAVARYKDSINSVYDKAGKIHVVENPGFPTNIYFQEGGRAASAIQFVIEMNGITSFEYIDVLQIYIRSFIRLFLYPKTIQRELYENILAESKEIMDIEEEEEEAPKLTQQKMMVTMAPPQAAHVPPASAAVAAVSKIESPPSQELDEDLFEMYGEEGEEEGDRQSSPEIDFDLYGEDEGDDEGENETDEMSGGIGSPNEEDAEQIEMKKKLLADKSLHPNPFAERRETMDKILFKIPTDKNNKTFTSYSRACPANVYRQPVLLTDEEKENIDKKYPGSYNKAIKYGSDREHMYWYICPRYWCLLTNTSMTEADIRAGKCGNSTKLIPKGAKKIPKDAFIYEFNDYGKEYVDPKGNYIPHFPGLTQAINESYKKYPCCFKKWDSDVQMQIDNELLPAPPPEAAPVPVPATEPAAAPSAPPVTQVKRKKEIKRGMDTSIGYVIGAEKVPVPEGKWGFLPIVIQYFLQTNNYLCARPENPSALKKEVSCLLRYGVEGSAFLACVAHVYAYKNKLTAVPSVDEFRQILSRFINDDNFGSLQGGELFRIFGNKETFIQYLLTSPIYEIDYEYLWDIICSSVLGIFENGMNLIILEIPNTDVTGNVDIICPTTTYSNIPLYSHLKETILIVKTGKLYEPIFYYENSKDVLRVRKTFHLSSASPSLKKVLEVISHATNKSCAPIKTIDFVRPAPLLDVVRIIESIGGKIQNKVINYYGNVIGVFVSMGGVGGDSAGEGFIPCAPFQNEKTILQKIPSVIMDEAEWMDYDSTLEFLKAIAQKTNLPCRPVAKVIDSEGMITGILTETNQFIQLDSPTQDNYEEDDGLTPIRTSNFISMEKELANPTAAEDEERLKITKNIQMESRFYNIFRSLIRRELHRFENMELRKQILSIIEEGAVAGSGQTKYLEKLAKIVAILRRDLFEGAAQKIEFVDFTPEVLQEIEKGGFDSMATVNESILFPRLNLIHQQLNEEIYFARIADELLRYKHIRTFMFQKHAFLNLSNIKYNITENEIILLQNNLTSGDYFKNLVPEKYIITYSRAKPVGTVEPSSYVFTLEDQNKMLRLLASAATAAPPLIAATPSTAAARPGTATAAVTAAAAEKTLPFALQLATEKYDICAEVLPRPKGNINSKWIHIFPKKTQEIFFTKRTCSFSVIMYIFEFVFKRQIQIKDIKEKLVENYNRLFAKKENKDVILQVMKKEGKLDFASLIRKTNASIESIVMSEYYFMTNIDLWVFFYNLNFPYTIVLFSALKLKLIKDILDEETDWIILNSGVGGEAVAAAKNKDFIFVRSPTDITKEDMNYGVIVPAISNRNIDDLFMQELSREPIHKITLQEYLSDATERGVGEEKKRGRKKVIL